MSQLSPQSALRNTAQAITYDLPQPELRLANDGTLELRKGTRPVELGLEHSEWVPVNPVRCFPWSDATRFISLRDLDNHELFLVEQLGTLAQASQGALCRALHVAGFLLEVTSVVSIEEDFEIRAWKVATACGLRSFQTERDTWPHAAPGGGHMIQDVAGDVYLIPPLGTLDPRSQELLWPYVD
jgi:hypothetical protein